jgi:hypothetical protein
MTVRRWASVLLAVGVLLSLAPTASACSCAGGGDPRRALQNAEGAFIGRSLGRVAPSPRPSPTPTPAVVSSSRPADVRFEVEQDFKGNLHDEIVVHSDGACGFHAPVGKRVAMYLHIEGGRWTSGLCAQTDPETLRKASRPLPVADGEPPVRFLVGGSMGAARSFSLDARGRTVAYARAPGSVGAISVCPGSDVFVELVNGAVEDRWWKLAIAVRDVRTLRLRAQHPFTRFETKNGYDSGGVGGIACLDPLGRSVVVYGSRSDGYPREVTFVRVEGDTERDVYELKAAAIEMQDDSAFVAHGTTLREIDLRSGTAVDRLSVPPGTQVMDVSPDARHAVLSATGDGDRSKRGHYFADLTSGKVEPLRTRLTGYTWIDDETFVAFGPRDEVRIFDTSLNEVASWTGWGGFGGVVVDDVLYAAGYGELIAAPVRTGPKRTLRRFEFPQRFSLVLVPSDGASAPRRVLVSATGVGSALLTGGAALLLLAVAIVLSRRREHPAG